MMEFAVGTSVEAVDQLGIGLKPKLFPNQTIRLLSLFLHGDPSGTERFVTFPKSERKRLKKR